MTLTFDQHQRVKLGVYGLSLLIDGARKNGLLWEYTDLPDGSMQMRFWKPNG